MDVWCFPERKTEMRMTRWMCGVSLRERPSGRELIIQMGVEAIRDVVRWCRLRCMDIV